MNDKLAFFFFLAYGHQPVRQPLASSNHPCQASPSHWLPPDRHSHLASCILARRTVHRAFCWHTSLSYASPNPAHRTPGRTTGIRFISPSPTSLARKMTRTTTGRRKIASPPMLDWEKQPVEMPKALAAPAAERVELAPAPAPLVPAPARLVPAPAPPALRAAVVWEVAVGWSSSAWSSPHLKPSAQPSARQQ